MHKFTKKCSFQCFLFVIFEGVVQQAQKPASPGFPGSNVPIELNSVTVAGREFLKAGDQANFLLSNALTVAKISVPLDKYMYALSQNKFVYDFKGTDKLWSMNFNGGGRANISSSSLRNAKIETKLLGGVGNGLKYGGAALSFFSFASTEIQYRNHYIDDNQLLKGRLDNTAAVLIPVAAIGTIPGNYLGEKYHREIMDQVSNPNAATNKMLVQVLNFFGLPASQEQAQNGF